MRRRNVRFHETHGTKLHEPPFKHCNCVRACRHLKKLLAACQARSERLQEEKTWRLVYESSINRTHAPARVGKASDPALTYSKRLQSISSQVGSAGIHAPLGPAGPLTQANLTRTPAPVGLAGSAAQTDSVQHKSSVARSNPEDVDAKTSSIAGSKPAVGSFAIAPLRSSGVNVSSNVPNRPKKWETIWETGGEADAAQRPFSLTENAEKPKARL